MDDRTFSRHRRLVLSARMDFVERNTMTQERRKQIEEVAKKCRYDKKEGRLYSVATGKPFGNPDGHGYLKFHVLGRTWKVHRVVWFIERGTLPDLIDHIDGNRQNNRISNLREASFRLNSYNCTKKTSSTPYKGVTKAKTGRYRAAITENGKRTHLGYFSTPEEAAETYNRALLAIDPRARINSLPVRPDEKDDETAADEYALQEWPIDEEDEGRFCLQEEYPRDFRDRARKDYLAGRQSLRREKDAEIERLKELLEEANGWVKTHSMQTYNKRAAACADRIDAALEGEK